MAKKKSRVPPPPRSASGQAPKPVQAPKARKGDGPRSPKAPGAPRRTRLVFLGVGAAIAVVAVVIALVTVLGGGEDASAALTAAGCTDQTFAAQGREHVTAPKEGFEYNSFPPTSGPHHPQWALFNIYDRPVQQIRLIHDLEHGGVVVQYGDEVPQGTADQIRQWYLDDPTAKIVAPLPALGDKVALTAWTHLSLCPGFDEAAFNQFFDAYAFQGPERFPADRLQPGM